MTEQTMPVVQYPAQHVLQLNEQRMMQNAVLEFIEESAALYRRQLGAPQMVIDLRGGVA